MFFLKNSLNITTAGSTISDLLYTYYTFDSADINSTSVKNIAPATPIYDATLSSALMVDLSNNITGTSDISLNSSSSQYVTLPSLDIGNSTGLSIMFWFRNTVTAPNNIRIFDFGNGPASDNIEVYINSSNNLFLSIYKGATQYFYDISTATTVNNNCYRHIGITMASNGTFKYYLNGLLTNQTTGNQYPNTLTRTQNFIGKSSNNELYLNGGIGEFRIYNNVVSDSVVLNSAVSNTRINKLSNMSFYYKFKSGDLINSRIKNYATGVYDLSFLVPITAYNQNTVIATTSANAEIGITSSLNSKYNTSTTPPQSIIYSRYNSQFLYSVPVTATNTNPGIGTSLAVSTSRYHGLQLYNTSFTAPSTGGFTINFWIYPLNHPGTYNLPFISLNESTTTRRIKIGTNYAVPGISTSTLFYVEQLGLRTTISTGNFSNTAWRQVSLVVNYNNSTIIAYIDITGSTPFTTNLTYQDYSNCNFINCVFMNDIQNIYSPFNSYDRPVRAFMENFRIYNVPLSISELRALSVQTRLDSVV
jgi:hypothetical protein